MVHMYEKVCKTEDNQHGIKEILNENPFKNGPCIITILALPMFLKDINGSLNQVAELVNPNIDNEYDPDRRIFGLGFGDYKEEFDKFTRLSPLEDELEEFLSKYFYPLFIENNSKVNTLEVMKRFRNITFLTYCNGANVYTKIEEKIKKKMSDIGYEKSEIEMIFSQVCLAAISGNVIKRTGTSSLAITFGDVLDYDFEGDKKTLLGIKNIEKGYIDYGSSLGYATASSDDHSFKRHMTEDPELSPKIAAFLNESLNNALENKKNDIIDPITYEKMEKALSDSKSKTL